MGLFDKKSHIKSKKELDRVLKKQSYLAPKERKLVEERAKKLLHESSGMSQKEWQRFTGKLERDTKDAIDAAEARRLRKLGK
ncbi:MAG: hypothetical protein AAB730_01785 [Patescibacteria group bacterium]